MSSYYFTNGSILRDGAFSPEPLATIGPVIAESADEGSGGREIDLDGGFLVPGFIDLQVNGGGGRLFNAAPTVETISAIGNAHRPFGTTAFLPTLISDDLDVVDTAMRAVERAMADGVPGVIGIHLEGPFLSPARKGTHDAAKFRTLDAAAIRLLAGLKTGRTLVTLAPERCDPADIRTLVDAGVVVSVGHSDASFDEAAAAFAAGARGVTHLFNAMPPFHHRAPGVVGASLDDQQVYAGVVIDGHHVDPAVLRIAMRSRPRDRFVIVTDAMPTVGDSTGRFMLQGKEIRVENGLCVDADGTLSGSNLDMASAVRNAVNLVGLSPAEAAIMAATTPAALLRLPGRGRIEPGYRADLVWLDAGLGVRGVWQDGRRQR